MIKSFRYIAVEGPIGSGKTTLASKLSQDMAGRLILEESEQNPFLQKFYKNISSKQSNFAFQTQIFFLLSRYGQQRELSQQDLFNSSQISDYIFAKDKIFAYLNLNEDELTLYEKLFELLNARILKPDLVIFLQANVDILKERIKKRGIPYEKQISSQYLENLCQAYNQFFFQYDETPLLTVNCNEIDIINEEADYNFLIKEIAAMEHSSLKKHYITISSK